MSTQRPRLFVVDDDRAVLSLAGTGMSCLDVLRALRSMSPQCEAVLMTGYETFDAALDALKQDPGTGRQLPEGQVLPSLSPAVPVPLIDVQREHIVRTLEVARGNKAVAARLLGVSRRAFYRQLERHGLHRRSPGARRDDAPPAAEQVRGE
jgi:two-component system response regulator RegA